MLKDLSRELRKLDWKPVRIRDRHVTLEKSGRVVVIQKRASAQIVFRFFTFDGRGYSQVKRFATTPAQISTSAA